MKYTVKVDVQSLLITVEAGNEEEAIEKAESVFEEEARSVFYIEGSEVIEDL